jgi:8-oxo-dGTP diphosphatase
MKVRPAICLIKNDKVLLMRYEYNNQNIYNLPGGNPDRFETLPETLKRELLEELNVKIEVGSMILIAEVSLKQQNDDVLHCIFEGKITESEPVLNPNETTAKEIVWIPIEKLNDYILYPNIGSQLRNKLLNVLDEIYLGKINQIWL